jgi:hypothetical protein
VCDLRKFSMIMLDASFENIAPDLQDKWSLSLSAYVVVEQSIIALQTLFGLAYSVP